MRGEESLLLVVSLGITPNRNAGTRIEEYGGGRSREIGKKKQKQKQKHKHK